MTPEEKKEYNAIIEYNINGIYLKSRISSNPYLDFEKIEGEQRIDFIIKFIKDCVDMDLKHIKEKLINDEVPEVSTDLDSE